MAQHRTAALSFLSLLAALALLACAGGKPVATRSIVALDPPAASGSVASAPALELTPSASSGPATSAAAAIDRLKIVDCLLRGTTRKLGRKAIYVAPPRVVSTSQLDCEIRGGEYVAYDPAGYSERLAFWTERAEQGDPTAQYYAGEIYEQGLGTPPDYGQAAGWYERAAGQGHRQAKRALARLHERGLGVARDPKRALGLYLDSYGIDELEGRVVMAPGAGTDVSQLESQLSESKHEADRLRLDVRRLEKELAGLTEAPTSQGEAPATGAGDLAADRAGIESERRELDRDRAKLEDDRSYLAAREESLRQEKQALRERAAELDREQARLAERDRAASDRLLGVTEREAEAEARFARSQQTDADRKALEDARAELDGQRAALEEERSGVAAEREALAQERERFEGLASRSEEQAAQLEGRTGELAALEEQLAARASEIRSEEERLAGLTQRSEALASQIDELEAALARRQQELAEAERQVKLDIAGPTIHVVDPQLPPLASRGEESVTAEEAERRIVGQVIAPAGLEALTLNGEPVETDESLVFRPVVKVGDEGTRVTLVAIDRQGKQSSRSFVVRRGLPPVAAPPPDDSPGIEFGSYHALVIGNQNYAHMPDLETPHADAREIGQVLTNRYGFEVTTLLDADRYQLMTALAQLRKKLTSKDNLLVYYAGHGHLDEGSHSGYWLPVDAEHDNPALWLSTDEMTRQVGAMNAKHVLIVADSCYSGVITRNVAISIEGARTSKERLHWMSTMAKRRVRMALTAGGLIPIPDGGGGRHSIFAEALLSVLRANNQIMWGSQLHQAVAARVSYRAKSMIPYDQVPEYREMKHGDAEPGEFFFVPRIQTAMR